MEATTSTTTRPPQGDPTDIHPLRVDVFDIFRDEYARLGQTDPLVEICFGPFYPEGLHLFGHPEDHTWLPNEQNIVITHDEPGLYYCCEYSDDAMQTMEPDRSTVIAADQLIPWLRTVMARWATPIEDAPWSPTLIAADYLEMVRSNGPAFLANVAGLGAEHGGLYPTIADEDLADHATTICWEIIDTVVDFPATYGDAYDAASEACYLAAKFAIAEARAAFGVSPHFPSTAR